jgi:hypothetical protein
MTCDFCGILAKNQGGIIYADRNCNFDICEVCFIAEWAYLLCKGHYYRAVPFAKQTKNQPANRGLNQTQASCPI